jgi:hypothetical protein
MSFDPFGNDKSDLQQKILRVWDRNPDIDAQGVARKCDCSASYVRETLKEYRPNEYGNSGGLLGGGGGGLF